MEISLRNRIEQALPQLDDDVAGRLLTLVSALDKVEKKHRATSGFLAYVEEMWPEFISGYHHKRMADAFDKIVEGRLKRLIINMPPRHTKSEFASFLLPSYFLGKFPNKKVIQASHTAGTR